MTKYDEYIVNKVLKQHEGDNNKVTRELIIPEIIKNRLKLRPRTPGDGIDPRWYDARLFLKILRSERKHLENNDGKYDPKWAVSELYKVRNSKITASLVFQLARKGNKGKNEFCNFEK